MIIPGDALLATSSPAHEVQGTRENDSDFGQLLAEIENQAISQSDQEDGELRALESLLQVLVTMFQTLPTANPLPAGSAPGSGGSGLVSALAAEGAAPGAQLASVSAITVVQQESFSLSLDRQESTQNLSGLFTPHSTAPSSPRAHAAPTIEPLSQQVSEPLVPEGQVARLTTPPVAAIGLTDAGAADDRPLSQATPGSLVLPQAFPETASAGSSLTTEAVPQAPRPLDPLTAASAAVTSETSLTAGDSFPLPRRAAAPQQRDPEATPSLPHFSDGSFVSPRTGATLPTPAAEPGATAPPPSSMFEDVSGTRQWPRPLPSNTVWLHLEPRELGSLLVQVRVSEKRLIASFRAQSPEVETLLRSHLPALHASLSQQGFEVQPIAITLAAEGFNTHVDTGTGAFTQQHSTFHPFAQDQPVSNTGETRHEETSTVPRWPAERGHRLLDVLV